jgi:hypothetical protein
MVHPEPKVHLSGTIGFGLDTTRQDAKSVQAAVERALRVAGCPACGRLSKLDFRFIDPDPELAGVGILSFENQLR